MKLGRSQQKVYDYIISHEGCTIKEIGEALYDSTSSCAKWDTTIWPKEKITEHWARGLVTKLREYGKVRLYPGGRIFLPQPGDKL